LVPSFENVNCNAADDGTIVASVADNGTSPYSFEITAVDGTALGVPIAPTSSNTLTATFTNLAATIAGTTYTITVTADNGCSDTIDQTITQPEAMVVPAPAIVEFGCTAGNNVNNATITVNPATITGGSGNYVRYEFINDQGTVATADDVIIQSGSNNVYTETNLAGGTYIINVYDDNACVGSTTATIIAFDELQAAAVTVNDPISCTNSGEDITIVATGLLSDSATTPANYEFRILPAGTLTLPLVHTTSR